MTHRAFWFVLLFTMLLSSCQTEQQKRKPGINDILSQEGFLIKTVESITGTENWYFVPAKKIDSVDWVNDFRTNNLKEGFQFHAMGHDAFPVSFIEKHLDTLYFSNPTETDIHYSQLLLFPVKIIYKLKPEFRDKPSKSVFVQEVGNKNIRFGFNSLPINIQGIIPLVKPKQPITECACKRSKDDANEYLYKVCTYLKKQGDKYSDVPCNYKVRSIASDTLNGKKVVRVDLSCCYLGDQAYFDSATKELLEFSYGAM